MTAGYGPAPYEYASERHYPGRDQAASSWTEPDYEPRDPVAAQVRNAVTNRLQFMNSMHAVHAWDGRRAKPIGPHGLAFLYADLDPHSDPARPHYEARIATRLFLDGEDVDDLVRLLYELGAIAEDYLKDGGVFDPLQHMVQRRKDSPVPPNAVYIGVGVSSLDSAGGRWRDIEQRVSSALEVPGRCYASLTDNTRIKIERPARPYDPLQVWSTRSLNVDGTLHYRSWRYLVDDAADAQTNAVWRWLIRLNELTIEGQRRLAAAGHAARRRHHGN